MPWWLEHHPDRTWLTLDGSLVFTDLSGFTALNERLSRQGKVGAELMATIVTGIFADLLGVAAARGGDMLKFGGDALLLLFRGEGHVRRAAIAAQEMQSRLRRIGRIDTGDGHVRLGMSAGMHSGPVDLFLVGGDHRDLIAMGPAVTATTTMESVADAGEVLLSPEAARRLGAAHLASTKGPGVLLGRPPRAAACDHQPLEHRAFPALPFVPASLHDHLTGGGHAPEHRVVVVSFTWFTGVDDDLLAGRHDLVRDRIHHAISAAQEIFARHGVSFLATDAGKDGTKIMAATGAPAARGEDEDRMLLAATELVAVDCGLGIQVGINRGHAFAGDIGPEWRRTYTVIGDTTNTAARVMAKAAPGQVLATPVTLSHATTTFDAEELPPFAAKGKAEPLIALSVRGATGARHAVGGLSDTGLVGRDAELARLTDVLTGARAGGGGEVQVVAEPGLGKSALLHEFVQQCTDLAVVSATCGPYGQRTAYFVLRQLLTEALGDRCSIEALRDLLAQRAPHALPWLPLLGVVLDVEVEPTPEVVSLEDRFRAGRLHRLVIDVLQAAAPGDLVLIVEDVHWLDTASTAALEAIAQALPDLPWLLLTTRRSGEAGYVAGESAVIVPLEPLDEAALMRLARDVSDRPLLPHDIARLVERSGGNPLFLRELVRVAAQSGTDALPDSVEALLAARIDRLDAASKVLLRHGAVLGIRFGEDLLTALLPQRSLMESVDWAQLNELIERRDGHVRFRHALVRDAAYEALSYQARLALHGRAAELYQQRGGPVDLIAIHAARANDAPTAWRYGLEAARSAAAKLAHAEAIEFYRLAVEAAPAAADLDEIVIAGVWEALGDSCEIVGRYDEAATAYRSARRLAADHPALLRKEGQLREHAGRYSDALRWYRRAMHEAGDDERRRLALAYAGVRLRQGRHADAIKWAEPALTEAEHRGDDSSVAHASYLLHLALTSLGRPERTLHRTRAIEIYERTGNLVGLAKALNNLGVDAYYEGHWDAALSYWTRSHHAMTRVGDQVGAATLANNIGEILSDQGHLDEAREHFDEARSACTAAGYPLVAAVATKNAGRVATRSGCFDEAEALVGAALEEFRRIRADSYAVEAEVLLAEVLVARGRGAEAIERLASLVPATRESPAVDALAHRLLGYAMAATGDTPGARAALETSRAAGAAASARYEIALTDLAIGLLDGDAVRVDDARGTLASMGVETGTAASAVPASIAGPTS